MEREIAISSFSITGDELSTTFSYQTTYNKVTFIKSIRYIYSIETAEYLETFLFSTYKFTVGIEICADEDFLEKIDEDCLRDYYENIQDKTNFCTLYIFKNKPVLVEPNENLKKVSDQLGTIYKEYYEMVKGNLANFSKNKKRDITLKLAGEWKCQQYGHSIFQSSHDIICYNCSLKYKCISCHYLIKHDQYRYLHDAASISIVYVCDTCKNTINTTACSICKMTSCDCGHPCGCTC